MQELLTWFECFIKSWYQLAKMLLLIEVLQEEQRAIVLGCHRYSALQYKPVASYKGPKLYNLWFETRTAFVSKFDFPDFFTLHEFYMNAERPKSRAIRSKKSSVSAIVNNYRSFLFSMPATKTLSQISSKFLKTYFVRFFSNRPFPRIPVQTKKTGSA